MAVELTAQQQAAQVTFRRFVDTEIVPIADQSDREECLPPTLIQKLAQQGYLGALAPEIYGGSGMDWITFGLLNEEIGRGCSSVRSLVTVHNMVIYALLRWGSHHQKTYWLPKLASGEVLAAFGLTEPDVGSDAKDIRTSATRDESSYHLTGHKKWITGGQIADLFLIFAQDHGQSLALLVERGQPGLSLVPISGMLGTRASFLAELHMNDCIVPVENLVGRSGFGFSHVLSAALHVGRYSVAWGCVGISQASLEASIDYTSKRQQFGKYLREHQLIRQLITDMFTHTQAARLLCLEAGHLNDIGDPQAIMQTTVAKYFASTTAVKATNDAVQLHGANGCSSEYSIQRYLRDARIMEIIEGSTQIQQITIADYAYQAYLSSNCSNEEQTEA